MAMSFGRFLTCNILALTKPNPLPLCRIHAINRYVDNPLKAAAIGIRLRSTGAPSKAKTTTAGAKRTVKKPTTTRKTVARTTSRVGKTTTKAKSTAVKKKPAPKKPAAKKKLASKRKLASKKKPAAKKKKKIVKPLTPKQEKLKKKRSLRELVLDAPKIPTANPYATFVALGGGAVGTKAAENWRALSPAQQQEYAEKGRALRNAAIRDCEQWVKSQDIQEVYKANRARRQLKRLGGRVAMLKDPRMPKRPVPTCAAFLRDQWNAGTFTNPDGSKMDAITAIRNSHNLYEKLPAAEKKAYEDQYAADKVVYKKAIGELLGDLKKL